MNFDKPAKVNLLFVWLVLAVLQGTFFPVATAAESSPTINNPDSEILDSQKKFHRLKQGIEDHKSRIRESRDKEKDLLTELETIDQRLENDQKKLSDLNLELQQQKESLLLKQRELDALTFEKGRIEKHVKKRLAAYYQMGKIGVMNVIFSAATLPDLLGFNEQFRHLLEYDRRTFTDYRTKIDELTQAREELLEEKERLENIIGQVEEQEKALTGSRRERMDLLTRVNTEKKLYQRALEELEEASEQLTAKLAKFTQESRTVPNGPVRHQESSKKKRPAEWRDFITLKGRLDPPVPGEVITYFGKNTNGKFGITTYANGINIKTEPGTEIRAIYDGKVAYTGTLRGYGNLMIIDHGEQYYSLISRAEKFLFKEGDIVKEGEVVGIMSDEKGILGEGLHFEIRHGTEPENPLHWLNNAKLTIHATPAPR